MFPNTYSLVSVSTRAERRGIEVLFSSPTESMKKFYPFFPSAYYPRTSTTIFETLFQNVKLPRHQLVKHEKSIQVMAGTFHDLKTIAIILYRLTRYFPSLVEPERQFLLTQGWRYFQAFDKDAKPLPSFFEPAKLPFMAEEYHTTLNGLQQYNKEMEKNMRQRVVLSHELFLPPRDVPLGESEQLEILQENHYFTQQRGKPIRTKKTMDMSTWNMKKRNSIPQMARNSISEGEGNCTCCEPSTIYQSNVHESSTAECTSGQDGMYIHTENAELSETYHTTHSEKEKRVRRAKEWGLLLLPIGPLRRGEKIHIPIEEARRLHQEENVHVIFQKETSKWTCQKNPGIATYFFEKLEERQKNHETVHQTLLQPYLSQHQLFYLTHAQKDPKMRLHEEGASLFRKWSEKAPLWWLTSPRAWQ